MTGRTDPKLRVEIEDEEDREISRLAEEGRIPQAIALAERRRSISSIKRQNYIVLLLSSHQEGHWELALQEAREMRQPQFYIRIAYYFWHKSDQEKKRALLDKAIAIAEEGLSLSKSVGATALMTYFHNSLAYYYADTEDPEKESIARRHAEQAMEERKENASVMDTWGYLKIIFGKTRQEILEGIDLCERARYLGSSLELYRKHIMKARGRLETLH